MRVILLGSFSCTDQDRAFVAIPACTESRTFVSLAELGQVSTSQLDLNLYTNLSYHIYRGCLEPCFQNNTFEMQTLTQEPTCAMELISFLP